MRLKLRKTSCWKCAKGLKMIIKEKKPSLKLCEKSLPASDTTWKLWNTTWKL
ncbi:hypothetical protein HanRHA438_Chr10g0444861 [Helianthus annuus]|uniref:Uncharacterized protein n=1 Tax=Helianthus annuus TaxID=4232 RepID=A0A9K3N3U2_HELAN|nr:hypothetical protein HanXRQr2_Chr10g0432371 [Helianthus annuus]KAJ0513272.1 hypothetical protein HanHA300_Chr10g0355671 [Helianthus annuus]KAJ0529386.1 hypothetical protein HanHA89_Chr10g0377261 [Helianthus annuus]KAJ0696273.1 hypothetical protein HanLR1_Chr10g0355171 [Helianthus annuus]KAJ0878873.1 hypothetical protein HanRHA438_Chr10g0444861 [Helianthus annuus]